MQIYIIRPYYGYDCNSVDGFNNGCYLDEIEVTANSEDDAIEQCITLQKESLPKETEYLDFGDFNTVSWVTDYCDGATDDTNIDDDDDNCEYLYKYIDFGDVRLKD